MRPLFAKYLKMNTKHLIKSQRNSDTGHIYWHEIENLQRLYRKECPCVLFCVMIRYYLIEYRPFSAISQHTSQVEFSHLLFAHEKYENDHKQSFCFQTKFDSFKSIQVLPFVKHWNFFIAHPIAIYGKADSHYQFERFPFEVKQILYGFMLMSDVWALCN